jgi:hypothetical protein
VLLQIGLRLSRLDSLAATFSPEPNTTFDITTRPTFLLFLGIRTLESGSGGVAMATFHLRTLLPLDIINFWAFRL